MGGGGDHQARSPLSDDVTHAYRTQRGNRAITRASNISMCLAAAICRVMGGVPHIYAKAAPGGFQHNSADFLPILGRQGAEVGSKREYRGVTNIRPPSSRQVWARLPPPTEVITKGEPSRRARAAAPGYFLFLPQEYIICRAMETDCLRFTRRAPTSEGGADKPPNPTEKDMRRISEGGEILKLGICGEE